VEQLKVFKPQHCKKTKKKSIHEILGLIN
jgi:hypothetical protein